MKKTIFLAALVSFTLLFSCTEDPTEPKTDEPTTNDSTKLTDQIIGTWDQVALMVEPKILVNNHLVNDLYSVMPSCMKDDLYHINKNNVFILDPGIEVCDSAGIRPAPTQWKLDVANKRLTLDSIEYQIISIDNNEMELSYQKSLNALNYQYTTKFTKK